MLATIQVAYKQPKHEITKYVQKKGINKLSYIWEDI